jgi:hypothetical protein
MWNVTLFEPTDYCRETGERTMRVVRSASAFGNVWGWFDGGSDLRFSSGKKKKAKPKFRLLLWSGWRDLNPRPLRPERSALPSCATARFATVGNITRTEV